MSVSEHPDTKNAKLDDEEKDVEASSENSEVQETSDETQKLLAEADMALHPEDDVKTAVKHEVKPIIKKQAPVVKQAPVAPKIEKKTFSKKLVQKPEVKSAVKSATPKPELIKKPAPKMASIMKKVVPTPIKKVVPKPALPQVPKKIVTPA